MTKIEFANFAAQMKTAYPKAKVLDDPNGAEMMYRCLKDIDYTVIETFLQQWMMTEQWPPTVADIREGVLNITGNAVETWDSAWQKVQTAIGRFGMYQKDKAMAWLPPLAAEAVQRLGWQTICQTEEISFTRNQFEKIYKSLQADETKRRVLPEALKKQLEQLSADTTSIKALKE